MRGEASLQADRTSRDSLAPRLREKGTDAWRIGDELFAVTDLLDHNDQVERSLTDPSRPATDKVALITEILAGQADPLTVDILTDLVSRTWSKVKDIANAVEDFAVDAMMYYADATDSTLMVSVELAQIHSALLKMSVLGSKLSDDFVPAQARLDLLHTAFDGTKLNKVTMRLVEHAAVNPRHRRFLETLEWLIAKFTRHMGESMVTVTTAAPLNKPQIKRLTSIYSAKLGRPVHINSSVDPTVIGGMRVQIGADVMDNTVAAQLSQLKRKVSTQM
ncbi:F0F1 ATP synthase subunit delta [Bifidobacterium sp. ESL0745]|uniref:F0F1 ATP synthase subunit delta n=1 Tax=Bifidobacterium sp. ESL0745 TaxID=2983226 RepID=UPI0023F78409|nr:F0F1 ATP synthase subunit delta [Bifidobacterium sp. ESL0745]MDF7665639.1 F0F1 ATP synthase subunit delta [Bifidobacterium sp. ESL0745]